MVLRIGKLAAVGAVTAAAVADVEAVAADVGTAAADVGVAAAAADVGTAAVDVGAAVDVVAADVVAADVVAAAAGVAAAAVGVVVAAAVELSYIVPGRSPDNESCSAPNSDCIANAMEVWRSPNYVMKVFALGCALWLAVSTIRSVAEANMNSRMGASLGFVHGRFDGDLPSNMGGPP